MNSVKDLEQYKNELNELQETRERIADHLNVSFLYLLNRYDNLVKNALQEIEKRAIIEDQLKKAIHELKKEVQFRNQNGNKLKLSSEKLSEWNYGFSEGLQLAIIKLESLLDYVIQ